MNIPKHNQISENMDLIDPMEIILGKYEKSDYVDLNPLIDPYDNLKSSNCENWIEELHLIETTRTLDSSIERSGMDNVSPDYGHC